MNLRDTIAVRMAFRGVLAKIVKAGDGDDRDVLSDMMRPGERVLAVSPMDENRTLAQITKTKPEQVAVITDGETLRTWLEERGYDDQIETAWEIKGRDDEVIDALLLHAPDLLRQRRRIAGWAEKDLKARTLAAKEPIGPGGELDVPGIEIQQKPSVLQVRTDPDAAQAIAELWAAKQISIDGTPKEIES